MKKGFTLIELLAVIAVIAIVALITIPIALNSMAISKKNSIKSSTYGYIDAINKHNEMAEMPENYGTGLTSIEDGVNINISTINVSIKGKSPDIGKVTIVDGEVTSARLCFDGYEAIYANKKVEDVDKSSNCVVAAPNSFAADSWSTIASNPTSNKYHVGDEKEVVINGNSYTVRIANNSTPAVCSTQGYSQTACGFVIEFVDVIENRTMNPTTSNAGGWEASAMRTYLNGDFYNSLPVSLKSVIINTNPVVSGSGSDGVSLNASDKIYLLSTREVGLDISNDNKRDVNTDTRTLDYYVGTTTNSEEPKRVKKDLTNTARAWWTRTNSGSGFVQISDGGQQYFVFGSYAISSRVAPAFRIG